MRSRNLKPGIYKNHALAQLGDTAFRLFTGLWCMADRQGRLKDEPEKIQAELFPFRFQEADMEQHLGKLATGEDPFIVRYEIEGIRYVQIKNFLKHQRPHPREVASIIPPCKKKAIPRTDPVLAKDTPSPSGSSIPSFPSGSSGSSVMAADAAKPYPLPDPKKNPTACLVVSYKTRKGVPYDSRDWDSLNWGRCSAAAKVLLSLCGDLATAEKCMTDIAEGFDTKGMTWTLETIAKHAPDWLKKNGRSDANTSRAGLRMAIAKRQSEGDRQSGLVKVSEGSLLSPFRDGTHPENGDEADSHKRAGELHVADVD